MAVGVRKLLLGLYLAALGVGAVLLAQAAWNSVTAYKSDYAIETTLEAGPALTERLVLAVLDGVNLEASKRMPALQALAERGSSGVALVALPSLSNPGRATLSTGALPEVHGVTNNGRYGPPPVQSIFSLARGAGVPIAVFGGEFWPHAFEERLGGRVRTFRKTPGFVPTREALVEWQADVCAEMIPFLTEQSRGLLVAGVTATDEAGHEFGGRSDNFLAVVAEADRCIAGLVEALDDGATTFVVTADHGHIDRRGAGGHGGAEAEVRRVPLVLAGNAIAREQGWSASHLDVAPTIAALLGLPLPANSQGDVLLDVLDIPDEQRRELAARQEAQQRLLENTVPDRAEGMAAERGGRAPFALLAAVWFLATLVWAPRHASPSRLAAALAAYFVCYFTLFWILGLGYSLSAAVRQEYLNSFFLRNMAAAAAATIAAALAYRGRVLRTAVAVVALVGLRVAWVWYDSGLVMQRYMLDLDQAFMAYLDLLQIFAVGSTACVWAAVAAVVSRRRSSPEP